MTNRLLAQSPPACGSLGKLDLAYAGPLARFDVAQVKDGRMTGGHLNCKDILSPYCRRKKNVVVERPDRFDEEENQWQVEYAPPPRPPHG
jgi:hypothetical protein